MRMTITLFLVCLFPLQIAVAQATHPLRIGVIFPFSGKEARQGQLGRIGIDLALREFGASFQPEIFYEDSHSDAKEAVLAFSKLQALNKVEVVLSMGSPIAMALLPMANRAHIVLLAMAVVPGFSVPSDYGFRLMSTAPGFAQRMQDLLLNELGKQRIGLLYVEDDYGSGYAKVLGPALKDAGRLVAQESCLPGTSDYRPALLKLKMAKPDAVILAVWGLDAGSVLRQSKEIGLAPDIFACPGACDNPDLIVSGSGATESVVVVASAASTTPQREKALLDNFNEAPTSVVLRFYDAMLLLRQAQQECAAEIQQRGTCVRSVLRSTRNIMGSSYPLSFDGNGDIVDTYQLKLVRDNKFVPSRVENQKIIVE